MGFEDRAATNEEMAQMKTMLEESMDAGAFGISTGLSYPPGVYTSPGTCRIMQTCRPGAVSTALTSEANLISSLRR